MKSVTENQIDHLAYRVVDALIAEGIAVRLSEGHSLLGVATMDLAVDLNLMLSEFFKAHGVEIR